MKMLTRLSRKSQYAVIQSIYKLPLDKIESCVSTKIRFKINYILTSVFETEYIMNVILRIIRQEILRSK
jgi:hypothetical protein